MGLFRDNVAIVQIGHNVFKNPNWQEAKWVGYLQFTVDKSVAEDLKLGLPWTNPASGQSGTWTQGFQITSPAL